mgnify:CR=1 FL=1
MNESIDRTNDISNLDLDFDVIGRPFCQLQRNLNQLNRDRVFFFFYRFNAAVVSCFFFHSKFSATAAVFFKFSYRHLLCNIINVLEKNLFIRSSVGNDP